MPYSPESNTGHAVIATSTTAKSLMDGLTVPAGTNKVRFTVLSQDVYTRSDGTAPTATTGILYAKTATYEKDWNDAMLNSIKIVAGGTGSIVIEFIKEIV